MSIEGWIITFLAVLRESIMIGAVPPTSFLLQKDLSGRRTK